MPHATGMCLLVLCLLGSVAGAQPSGPCTPGEARRVELPVAEGQPAPEVRLGPGRLTALLFDAPLDGPRVRQALAPHAAGLHFWDVGARAVVLVPARAPGEGERWALEVAYEDGALPARATLTLVAHEGEADTCVWVRRQPRTPASLLEELEATRRELEATRTALAAEREAHQRLRAPQREQAPPGHTPAGRGEAEGDASAEVRRGLLPSGPLEDLLVRSRVGTAPGRVQVELLLANPEGGPAWGPGSVTLKGPTGEEMQVLEVRTRDWPGRGGETFQRVEVEVRLEEGQRVGRVTLELWAPDGTLALRLAL